MPELEHLGPEDSNSPLNGYSSLKHSPPIVDRSMDVEVMDEKHKILRDDLPLNGHRDNHPTNNKKDDSNREANCSSPENDDRSSNNSPIKETDEQSVLKNCFHADDDLKSEEEKIQEYMKRSDTAVIFAEPVDGELQHEESPEPQITGTKQSDHQKHKRSKNEFALKCPQCTQVFTGIHAVSCMKDHLTSIHGESEEVALNNNKYSDNNESTVETNNKSSLTENHPAVISTTTTTTTTTTTSLISSHGIGEESADGIYRCDKCSSSFNNIDHLEKHLLLHSPTTQSCRVCHKTFANVYRLQRHMISHDESAVLRKFKCPECEKAFKFKHHLKEHVRIHSGEKPFECPNCGKRFSHSGSYSSHMTSKKCLVVNLKVRRSVDRVRTGGGGGKRNSQHQNSNIHNSNNNLRPIIPKYGDDHQDIYNNNNNNNNNGDGCNASSSVAPTVTVPSYVSHHSVASDHFPTPAAAMLTSSYSQQPSIQPFLHSPSFSSMGLHPLLASHFHNSGLSSNPYFPTSIASSLAAMAANIPDIHQAFKLKPEEHVVVCRKDSEREDPNCEEKKLAAAAAAAANKRDFNSDSNDFKDLKAVRKILEIVDATAKQQKSILPDSPSENKLIVVDKMEFKSESEDERLLLIDDRSLKCEHCNRKFYSSAEFQRHQLYLCHETKVLVRCDSTVVSPVDIKSEIKTEPSDNNTSMDDCGRPGSTTGTGESDDDSTRDNGDDDNSNNEEGKKWRVRSLFSEEHLHILKSFYKLNPRPKKYDVERIANQIGFATRVVQVWFQNMRARDRRRGRSIQVPYFTNNQKSFPSSNPPGAYHPAIVSPYNGVISPNNHNIYYSQKSPPIFINKNIPLPSNDLRTNGECQSPSSSPTNLPSKASTSSNHLMSNNKEGPTTDEQPLDLSMRSSSKDESDDNALNLSRKSSRTSTPSRESNNSSSISNGVVLDGLGCKLVDEPVVSIRSIQHDGLTATSASQLLSNLKSRAAMFSNNDKSDNLRYLQRYPPPTTLSSLQHILSIPPLHPLTDHANLPPVSNYVQNNGHPKMIPMRTGDSSHSPASYSHSEYNSDDALIIDDGVNKHLAKRSWQNMDAEDNCSLDDDPLSKQNGNSKSWKHSKLLEGYTTTEEGMYSCDQCDKMFSKQSSLARHKYEHSGQRPHKCEQCGKAFKHKHHLTEHRRLHSGEKPFQCKKCLKRFSHSGSYSQHMNHRYSYCKPYRE